jgi:hypothetical protein
MSKNVTEICTVSTVTHVRQTCFDYNFFYQGLVAECHLFCLCFIFYNIHSFNHIHTIHLSIAIRRGFSPFPHHL